MTDPQSGIVTEPGLHRRFLEYTCRKGADENALKLAVCQARQAATDDTIIVVGFGHDLWQKLTDGQAPAGSRAFLPVGPAPATQGDIWFWIHGDNHDVVLEVAIAIHQAVRDSTELTIEIDGFSYHNNRDLIGFVDGTANPKGEAAPAAAFLNNGGAFVLTQKWAHDLSAFDKLAVSEQEQVIGRTKADDIELEGDAMPATSHVSRTDLKLDGVPAKILRRSTPYGGAGENGLYFVAFACDIDRFDVQLCHMFGLAKDRLHDRLTEFSTPVSGAYWYAPAIDELASLDF